MPAAVSNRLLPILSGAVVLMLVAVTIKSCSREDPDAVVMASVPRSPAPDADSPADTIKTLTANVAAMTAELEALRGDNGTLRRENQALIANRTQIEENVATRLRRELESRENGEANRARIDAGVVKSLTQRVDGLADSLSRLQGGHPGSDIPVGLGLDGAGAPAAEAPATVWVEPLDAPSVAQAGLLERSGTPAGGQHERTGKGATRPGAQLGELTPKPVYTVPRNATLIGSSAMTALVGRVPIQGQVRDPMPFKIITGAENLAANGLTVPGVHGMVWSGTAVGDWTLACVTGRLESVTFVFDDGTVRTLSSDDRNGEGGDQKPLGWISDAQGIPCISGERKTNAPAFLAQRLGIQAVEAAANAAAAAETTTVVSDAGTVTGSVTGDIGPYVLGKTAAGGSEEIARWLLERQSQSFDAVFVPAGRAVAIHVDRELPIDFDPTGRKLHHAEDRHADRDAGLD